MTADLIKGLPKKIYYQEYFKINGYKYKDK